MPKQFAIEYPDMSVNADVVYGRGFEGEGLREMDTIYAMSTDVINTFVDIARKALFNRLQSGNT